MAPPVILIVAGIAVEGSGAISWAGAILWGVVATIVFTGFSIMGKAIGMTRMELLDLLGSMAAPPGSAQAKLIGVGLRRAAVQRRSELAFRACAEGPRRRVCT